MGINTHVYTVYGVRLDWDDAFYEAYEEVEEALLDEFGWGNPQEPGRQIEVVMDCMGGEYMILGPILYDSGDFRYCEGMNNYQEIGIEGSPLLVWLDYVALFKRLYPSYVHLIECVEPKLINLIHYT